MNMNTQGRRIKAVHIAKSGAPVNPGETGTVWRVTQLGGLRVVWDSGARFDLDPKVDKWEELTQ
jgi:hypothetical protein